MSSPRSTPPKPLRDVGRPVTSYDVAERAGVSQSAVSRCFSPGGSISERTRAKVVAAADALGYRPNAIARSLITQQSNMVAILVANLGFHPTLTALLSRCFAARGLHVLLFTLDQESDADRIVDEIWQYRVDGVIAGVHLPARHIDMFAQRRTPLVFINRLYRQVSANSVCCDQVEGERLLVDRLIAAGHRRFGLIAGPADSHVSEQRVAEAEARLHRAGVSDIVRARGDFGYNSGRRSFHELVAAAGGRSPEAVMCANDSMAMGCMDAARYDLGLSVPADVSIVGFDGQPQAFWASYDLVTVRQPLEAMAEAAADMLLARVGAPALGTERRMFSGELILGSSARM